jgi:hypothetical protein
MTYGTWKLTIWASWKHGEQRMTTLAPIMFLVDVDDTLLDNDFTQNGLRNHVKANDFGQAGNTWSNA